MADQHWNDAIAASLAQESGVLLSARHWEVIRIYRELYLSHHRHPITRVFVKALHAESSTASMLELMQLFGERPLATISFIAGLPKPPHCV